MQCSFVSIKKCQISPFNDDEKLILSPRRCDHVWLPKFPNNVKVKMWRNITSVGETSPELLIGGTEQNPLVISLAFSGCKTYLEIIIFFSDYVHQTKTNETKGKNVIYAYLHLKVFHELKEYIQNYRWDDTVHFHFGVFQPHMSLSLLLLPSKLFFSSWLYFYFCRKLPRSATSASTSSSSQ